jgi:hypothetical protein
MSSDINVAIPPLGTPTTSGVRANFAAAKAEIEELQTASGFVDYNDAATGTVPISVSPSTWTKLTNDKAGPYTKIDQLPALITNLWNTSTNQLVLTEVPVNSVIFARADLIVTTTTANQVVKFRSSLGIGSASAFQLESSETHFKSSGAKNMALPISFYIGSDNIRTFPGEFQLWSDASCDVRVNGWYIVINKKLL